MQNNSNKWRAFIITFIIITLLLVGAYFLFRNSGSANNTKGDTIAQKFSSLFGTSKQKQINTVVDTGLKDISPSIPPVKVDDNIQQGSNTPLGPNNTKPVAPGLNPFPYTPNNSNGNYVYNPSYQSKLQCEDGLDNDGDGSIDKNDAGCHTDLDAKNANSYDQWLDDESAENGPNVIVDKKTAGGCTPNKTILFSADDQKRINELLRDFYRLAPNLATKEDITIEAGNAKAYKDTIDSAISYTKQCYDERKINAPSASNAPQKILKAEYADSNANNPTNQFEDRYMTIPPGKYMLEAKKSPLFTSSTIQPSDTFLPGYHGTKFEIPVVSPRLELRKMLFNKGGAYGNDNDIKMSLVIQDAGGDGDTAGRAIASHILQGFRDVGILKYYLPDNNIDPKKKEIVLKMFQNEVDKYMNTLKSSRDAWADHTGHNGLSDFTDWGTRDWGDCCQGYRGALRTREMLDAYIKSGDTDEVRYVDVGAQTWITGFRGDWVNALYEKKNTNLYQQFEQKFENSIW
jgi:hypothetical protein